jgi:hypothetical protein
VRHISDDFRDVQVSMGLGWYNRNYVGTQFGGSLYSMVDPFFMLMLMENLGATTSSGTRPPTSISLRRAKARCSPVSTSTTPCSTRSAGRPPDGKKYLPQLQVDIHDGAGNLVARVGKTLYVRLKPQARQA